MNQGRYIALLRGINVGGKNIITMDSLRARFEAMGFTEVRTYIQSGNVVFSSKSPDKPKLVRTIEESLSDAFGYRSRVVLVSSKELEAVVAQAPPGFGKQPTRYRYDVVFVKEPLTAEQALQQLTTKAGVDTVHAGEHALYFRRLMAKNAFSQLTRLTRLPVYQRITIRNWNTTTRLLAMASREPSAEDNSGPRPR